MRRRTLFSLLALVALVFASASASAGGFDGKSNLVCSSVDVVACINGPECLQGHAREFELPEFVFVDFAAQVIRGTDESGIKEVSPIRSTDSTDKQIALQGFENHHGWTLAIDRKSGQMTLTSTGPEVSFMIFGACTPL